MCGASQMRPWSGRCASLAVPPPAWLSWTPGRRHASCAGALPPPCLCSPSSDTLGAMRTTTPLPCGARAPHGVLHAPGGGISAWPRRKGSRHGGLDPVVASPAWLAGRRGTTRLRGRGGGGIVGRDHIHPPASPFRRGRLPVRMGSGPRPSPCASLRMSTPRGRRPRSRMVMGRSVGV